MTVQFAPRITEDGAQRIDESGLDRLTNIAIEGLFAPRETEAGDRRVTEDGLDRLTNLPVFAPRRFAFPGETNGGAFSAPTRSGQLAPHARGGFIVRG
jgi:hypothetical protein